MKKFFVKALAVLLVCMFVLSGIKFSVFADGSGDLGDKLSAVNVAISGQIKMMFYFTNVGRVEYYTVQVGEEVRTVYADRMPADAKGRSLLEVPLAAAQQTKEIIITPYDKDDVAGKVRVYKVTDYVEKVIELDNAAPDDTYTSLVKALKSMLNYGAMAQLAFDYNTGNLANAGMFFGATNPVNNLAAGDIRNVAKTEYTSTDVNKLHIHTSAAYLEDVVSIKCYFDYQGDVQDLQVSIEGFDDKIYQDKDGYYVRINNIPATKFDYQYTIAISDGTDTALLKYSVLNYVQGMINQNGDADDINAVRAMYQFYVWLSEYAGKSAAPSHTECKHERSYIEDVTYAEVCSDCGKDITPSNILENAANLSNNVNAYYGTIGANGNPVIDPYRKNFTVTNSHLKFQYPLSEDVDQLATITNTAGDVYVQDTMDVYVKTASGTYYASKSYKVAEANIYRYGYYYYDAHMYGQNFTDGPMNIANTANYALSNFDGVNQVTKNSTGKYTITAASDPYIYDKTFSGFGGKTYNTDTYNTLKVRIAANSTSNITVFYATGYTGTLRNLTYVAGQTIDFSIIADGTARDYYIDLPKGLTIYGLRLDFNGPAGDVVTVESVDFLNVQSSAPDLLLDRGLHTYSDKVHQVLSLVAPNSDVSGIQEIGMITQVVASDVYIKTTNGSVIESMTSGQTVENVAYAGFMTSAGVFGYILPAEVNNGVTYTNGSIKVSFDGTTYTITQVIDDVNTIQQQPTLRYEEDANGNQVPVLNNFLADEANKNTYGSEAIDSIKTSLNIYNSPTAFYFGQRIYTDSCSDFDAFIYEAEVERNPLGEENIEINTTKTPGATFDGYDPIRGIYAFTIPGFVSFAEGYHLAENFHGAVSFTIKGDDKDRNMYVMAYTPGLTVEGGAVLDKDDQMLPIPTEVSKNFGHEFEEPIWLWGDVGYSEVRVPVKVNAGEVQDLTVLHLFMNWGKQPLKQISSIQFFSPYYHLSTGVTETNCIANYYVHGKDLDTLPDHRAMSGTWWGKNDEMGDPQHDNGGYHLWLQYKVGGNKVTSEPIQSVITSSGPTYAEIDMTYISDDGKIKVTYTHMEMPQVDEMRTYYTMKYEILEDVTIADFDTEFTFYSVYGYGNGYQKFGYWGTNGAVNGISTQTKEQYVLGTDSPYFDMYQIDNVNSKGEQNKQNANVSFLIKDWSTTNATLNGKNFVVNVGSGRADLSLKADQVTLKKGETITINAIVMPWGTYESTNDEIVQKVRLNSLENPIKATAGENANVVDSTFLPTVKTMNGLNATFTLAQDNYAYNPKNETRNGGTLIANGINMTFRVDGFKMLATPKLYEYVNGDWKLVEISSANNPDKAGNAHEYDGYAVHYNSDGTYSYSFVVNISDKARTFKVVLDDTYVEWEEGHGDLFYTASTIYEYALKGTKFNTSLTKLSADGSYVTLADNNDPVYDGNGQLTTSSDPTTKQFAIFRGAAAKYIVIKYRHENNANPDAMEFFMSTEYESAKGAGDNFAIDSSIIEADGEWHVMVIDIAAIAAEKNLSALVPNVDGSYSISSFRFDPFTSAADGKADSYDVAYIAFCRDIETAVSWNKDMDISNISYVSGTNKSSNISDKLDTTNDFSDMNVILSGGVLSAMINSNGKIVNYTSEVVDGNVVYTKHNTAAAPDGTTYEGYFTLSVGNETNNKLNTGKYLVMKYRTESQTLTATSIYSSTTKDSAEGKGDYVSDVAIKNDGKWHVMVFDLSAISTVTPSANGDYEVNYVRIDAGTRMADGDSIEYAYIGLCDDLSDLACLDEKLVDCRSILNVDWLYADGDTSNKNTTATAIEGTLVEFYGWTAVCGAAADKFSYVVTDPYGIETVVDLVPVDDAYNNNGYDEGSEGVQNAVAVLGEGTVGYQVHFLANLYKWHGKTVTLSIRESVAEGVNVEVYSVKVTVPNSDVPGWITGTELQAALQNKDKYSATLNGSGTITITSNAAPDGTFDIKSHAQGITPKYALVRYKTTNAPDIYFYTSSGGRNVGGNTRCSLQTDGKWHTLVVDLTKSENYVQGEAITFMRVDVAEGNGQSVEIDYIYLCEEFSAVKGTIVDTTKANNVDYIFVDGLTDKENDTNYKGHNSITATTLHYTGWVGVDGFDSEGISYVVTDARGNETEIKLTNSTTADHRYYEDNNITNHLITNNKYSAGTRGYKIYFDANLANWAGQTVKVAIRVAISGGALVETFSVTVVVPAQDNDGDDDEPDAPGAELPEYISGAELQNYMLPNIYTHVLNSDGSLTLTANATHDNYTKWFGAELTGVPAAKYAVIRYKTTTETSIGMYARTTSSTGYKYLSTQIKNDGMWHTVVIDLESEQYFLGEAITEIRIDTCKTEGGSITIDYVWITDELDRVAYESYEYLDMSYVGTSLREIFIDGRGDADISGAVLNDDGTVTVSYGSAGDRYFTVYPDGSKVSGQYLVMKYRTGKGVTLTNASYHSLAYDAQSNYTEHVAIKGAIADGQWHILVIDLSKLGNGIQKGSDGEYHVINFRADFFEAFSTNGTVDFAYIGLCNNLSDIFLAEGEVIELTEYYNYKNNIDHIYANGVEVDKASTTVNGSSFGYTGWLGAAGVATPGISYVVTDANGKRTEVPLTATQGDLPEISNRYFERDDITNAVASLGAGTHGYVVKFTADLSAWSGQTVTIAIIERVNETTAVQTYAISVNVPDSNLTGEELKPLVNAGGYNTTLNGDGSITVTNNGTDIDGTISFNSDIMMGTPRYVVIRYKNPSESKLYIYAKTTDTDTHNPVVVSLKNDGMWHVVVVDLSVMGKYTPGEELDLMRFDICEKPGSGSITLDYVWFTDDISNVEYEAYDKLNYSFVGQDLVNMVTTGGWDNCIASAIFNADGTVTVTSSGSDTYFGHTFSTNVATGQYLVIKYRSGEGANVSGGVIRCLAATQGNSWSGHMPLGYAVADRNWHVLVINLADLVSVTATDGVYYMKDFRVDLMAQFAVGSSVDFAYIGLCDDLNDIILEEGEYLEYGWQSFKTSMDTVTVDGATVTKDSGAYVHMVDSEGASDRFNTFNGTVWNWEAGWFAVDNHALTDLSFCVTDENGVEHWTTVSFSPVGKADHTWYEATDITNHNIQNNGFGANTVGYRVSNVGINLSEYAGQTVTLSLRAITDSGHAVVLYSAFITVPN